MKACGDIRPRIEWYVDQELGGAEALDIEAHLIECDACRRTYEELRGTVDAVRGARPLYEAPERSYAASAAAVANWERRARNRRWVPAATAAGVLLAIAGFGWMSSEGAGLQTFASRAHRDYARGAFPLDVASSEPQVVSEWLEPRVPFHLRLPNYPEGGRKRYSLSGARLMQYRGEDVAYLAYEMGSKPISLLISSSSRILPAGGESYRSGGLTFHFSSDRGLRIITWTDKGLTYAQVSDLNVKGAESCGICHGSEGERRKFEGLGRRM